MTLFTLTEIYIRVVLNIGGIYSTPLTEYNRSNQTPQPSHIQNVSSTNLPFFTSPPAESHLEPDDHHLRDMCGDVCHLLVRVEHVLQVGSLLLVAAQRLAVDGRPAEVVVGRCVALDASGT